MKTRFYLSLIGLLLGSLFITACDNEDAESTLRVPTVYFNVENFWPYIANGETLTMDWTIDRDRSSQGIYIKQVEYYFDDVKIATSTSTPFRLNYLIQNKSIGQHKLKIKTRVEGDGYVGIDDTQSATITVLERPFVLGFHPNYDNEQHKNGQIRNGEVLSGNIELSEKTSFDATITKVEYYWDDKMIGATSVEPFKFYYQLENESLGTHKFNIVIQTSSAFYEVMNSTITEEITVIQ